MYTIIKDLSYNAKNKDTKPVPRIWLDANTLKAFRNKERRPGYRPYYI